MLISDECVLQQHPGWCRVCKERTHGILVGPGEHRHWYVADIASDHTWQVHVHQVGDKEQQSA